MKRLLPIYTICFSAMATSLPAYEAYYTLRMDNVYVGEFTFSHNFNNGEYQSQLVAETLGFGKSIIDANFEGKARGQGEEYRQYFPEFSEMITMVPDNKYQYEITFQEGQFSSAKISVEPNEEIDFTAIANVVDPVTAFTYVFRPIDFEHLCEMSVDVVDGVHHRRLVFGEAELRQDGRWQCRGAVERVAGYDENELIAQPYYKITAVYQRATEVELYLDRALVETPWGDIEIAYEYEINNNRETEEITEIDIEVDIDETN